ncbi:hypothetical protein Ddc_03158 [Ditylenchus destructor]|nr:hypothetical protein Ddc_03158 [Ditylenchus destructor]
MYLFDRRADVERSNALQKTFRQEILQKPEPSDFTMDLDIETQESLLKANLMDVEEAVLIIQCAERMYQAITRFVYLTDVRKKAMDLHADKKSLDPERAVILIQARTRGLLARNMVRRTREEEQRVLGLTVESLLKSKIAYRHKSKLINNSNPLPHSEDPKRGERIKPPSTFNDLIESFRSELFLADPLELRFNTNAGANSDMIDSFKKYEQETENLLTKLNNLGICRVLNNKDSPCFDEMTSFQADIHIHQRKHLISFDLRDFFYMSVVIPHILSGWPDSKRNRRHSILLVGDECSGKTSWASAIANKCGSVRITVGRRPTRIGRKRLFHYINQFVREDKYCVVLIDKLEVFVNDDAERKSSLKIALRELMEVLLKEDKCQVIGMSLVADLEPSILEHFSIMINIKRPPMVERFELIADTLSRRMETETLHRMPKRLVEVAKATGSMNCGRTILRTDKKFAK